jgi:antitoxin (DNA-binding transcriptional repressor) of toxin-antitoxin stability system
VNNALVIRIIRPYDTADEYIAAEGWTLTRRGVVLLDQLGLPADTVIRFDISLRSGERLVLAEGLVVGAVLPSGSRPGGVKVRFTRFGSSTKAFIDRVIDGVPGKITEPRRPSLSLVPLREDCPTDSGATGSTVGSAFRDTESGVHERPRRVVAAPPDREHLLERLRQRRRSG